MLFTGFKRSGLYILPVVCVAGFSGIVSCESDSEATEKWHLRLGHMSQKGLDILGQRGLFGKTRISTLNFCEPCVLAKQHRSSFSPALHKSKSILEYLHADLWGPESVCSHGGNKYFLSIIDDFSRHVFVFLLKSKDETFDKFSSWKVLIENQTSKKIKALRTDNGLEFCNAVFDDFCSEHGILRHRTIRHTPQQNGVAERMNRTLLEKVRSLLFTSGLPKSF